MMGKFASTSGGKLVERACLLFFALTMGAAAWGQASAPPAGASAPAGAVPQLGSVSGTVVDRTGAVVGNAKITLTPDGAALAAAVKREAVTDSGGHFVFAFVMPGGFRLTVVAPGFAAAQRSGMMLAGEDYVAPQIVLEVAQANVDVDVTLSAEQVAEDEVKVEEQQRILGVVPNYYVTYDPHAPPLTAGLKFQLAWKTVLSPFSFGITAGIAGIEQATDTYGGYGQGAEGYGKRYGASYADFVSGTFIGGAILPIVLKQDPRYFVKGTGTTKERVWYALANAVIRKSDSGRWQPDYSGILGGLAAGGISNLYYPDADRNGAKLTFVNTAIGIGGTAAGNLFQEFLLKKLTPHAGEKASKN
jgi:hypothetical protein